MDWDFSFESNQKSDCNDEMWSRGTHYTLIMISIEWFAENFPPSQWLFSIRLSLSLSLSLSLVGLFAVSRKIVAGKCFDWKSTEKNMIRFNMARNTRKIIISIRGQDLIMEMALHVILNYACKCVTIGCRRRCCCWFATVLPFALFVLCVCVSLSLIVRLFICRRRIVWRVRRANVISNIWQTRKRHTKKCSLLWCI